MTDRRSPANIAVAAGAIRRLTKPRNSKLSRHALSGWLLVPVVGIHAWIHRLRPAKAGVSPSLCASAIPFASLISSVSYQYVVFALQRQPWTSWAAYGVLAVAGSYHALAGWRRILSRDKRPARLQTPVWRAGFAALVSSLGLGLARLHAESPIPTWLAARYEPLL